MDFWVKMKILADKTRRLFWTAVILLMAGCSSLPQDYPRERSEAYENPEKTSLGKAFAEDEKDHPDESGYHLLSDGVDAFVARLILIEAAQKTIDLQYYIYRFDIAGQMLTRHLLQAADRGVRVRLLVDDMEIDSSDFTFAVLASHPNVQVRIFNPFAGRTGLGRLWSILTSFERVNQRMHNKIFAVDNQLAVVGGRNIADPYFSVKTNQYFADLELLAVGPIVRKASASFDEFWNFELAFPANALIDERPTEEDRQKLTERLEKTWRQHKSHEYRQRLEKSSFRQKIDTHTLEFIWAPGKVVYDSPNQITVPEDVEIDQLTLLGAYLEPHFDNTDREFLLISPYLIPGERGMLLFQSLRDRGVTMKILTNSLAATDMAVVYGAYADYRRPILEMEIELYELKPHARTGEEKMYESSSVGATLHAKTLVFDKAEIFIGSMNFDPRSVYYNTELGLIVTSPLLTEQVREVFARRTSLEASLRLSLEDDDLVWTTLEEGKKVRYGHSPYVGFWYILWSDLAELLVPNTLL